MTLLGYINSVSDELIRRTNGKISTWNFTRQRIIDLYDEGYTVDYACDLLLAGKRY